MSGKRQGNMHKEMDYQFLLHKQSKRVMTVLNPGWSFDHSKIKIIFLMLTFVLLITQFSTA